MKIKSLHIKNFKSIVDLTINEPNPFTVFVGPNGSGKSNIFEALEFMNYSTRFYGNTTLGLFGGESKIVNKRNKESPIEIILSIEEEKEQWDILLKKRNDIYITPLIKNGNANVEQFGPPLSIIFPQFISRFSRIFVNSKINRQYLIDDSHWLNIACTNLENVLKRIFENTKNKQEEISEWLDLFLPEFDRVEIRKSEFSSEENLLFYHKYYEDYFTKDLISDGTYNIIALLTAVYQSDEPQFLCIEEPENGLNPKVVKELVNFFRDACEEKGHYIWLNTHSQTLVSQLKEEEMIVVDKVNGETQIKQFKKGDFFGMPADEALLTNALGGGLPW